MATVPPANPAPPAPMFTLGRVGTTWYWIGQFPADTKLYYKAIAALNNKFDGTLEKFIGFLASVTSQARQFRWNSILAIPVGTDTRELLTVYGRISMVEINSHATTYTGTQTREAQNSEMLYHFLMNSVTTEFTTKLVLYQKDYTMNGAPIGACLLKKVVQLMYVGTMATASHICETLMDMHLKLPTFQHDIRKFNDWIRIEVEKLASRGQEANDLITYLWKSYEVVADKKFMAYIECLKDEHDEGRVTYTATQLMQLGQDKFEACEEKRVWGQLSEEQAKIVAMKAQLEKATPRQMKNSNLKKKETRRSQRYIGHVFTFTQWMATLAIFTIVGTTAKVVDVTTSGVGPSTFSIPPPPPPPPQILPTTAVPSSTSTLLACWRACFAHPKKLEIGTCPEQEPLYNFGTYCFVCDTR